MATTSHCRASINATPAAVSLTDVGSITAPPRQALTWTCGVQKPLERFCNRTYSRPKKETRGDLVRTSRCDVFRYRRQTRRHLQVAERLGVWPTLGGNKNVFSSHIVVFATSAFANRESNVCARAAWRSVPALRFLHALLRDNRDASGCEPEPLNLRRMYWYGGRRTNRHAAGRFQKLAAGNIQYMHPETDFSPPALHDSGRFSISVFLRRPCA